MSYNDLPIASGNDAAARKDQQHSQQRCQVHRLISFTFLFRQSKDDGAPVYHDLQSAWYEKDLRR
jgi:hypothetical protein